MENNFLSHKNFSYIINFVFNDVKNKTDIDISSNKKYIGILKKLIQTIYKKNMNNNVSTEFLNNLVIDKGIPFLVKQLDKEKNKNKNVAGLNDGQSLSFSQRPVSSSNMVLNNDFSKLELNEPNSLNFNTNGVSTRDNKIDFTKKLQEFNSERNYERENKNQIPDRNFPKMEDKTNDDFKNINVMDKLKELQNDRGYTNSIQIPTQNQNQIQSQSQNQSQQISGPQPSQALNIEKKELEIGSPLLNQLYENNNSNLPFQDLNENQITSEEEKKTPEKSYFSYDNSLDNYSVSINPLKNIQMNIRDTTNEIENSENSNIEDLKEEQLNSLSKSNKEEYLNSTLLSTNYIKTREKKQIISVDISSNLPRISDNLKAIDNYSNNYWHNFKVNLIEPLILDSVYDVYLESITINNPARAGQNNLYFVLKIDEFNIKTYTNNIFMMDKFVIPNENTSGSGDNKIMKYHLKSNYMASINPTKLNSLTYTITNENNESVNNYLISTTNKTTVSSNVSLGQTLAFNVSDETGISDNDLIFNSNGVLVGIVTGTAVGNITIGGGTKVALIGGEELFLASVNNMTQNNTNYALNSAASIGDTTISLGALGPGVSNFQVDDNIYTIDGSFVGKLTNVSDDGASLTFGDKIKTSLANTTAVFNINPTSVNYVFSGNSSSNRIIMEFILISR